jgi:hypothetical protein
MAQPKKQAYSGRGGERDGAGRPRAWKHTPTTAVRVPEPLVKQIMVYAHELDNGAVQIQTNVSEQLSELIARWQAKVQGKEKSPRWENTHKLLQELQSAFNQ